MLEKENDLALNARMPLANCKMPVESLAEKSF
jgi:hypothetical protein